MTAIDRRSRLLVARQWHEDSQGACSSPTFTTRAAKHAGDNTVGHYAWVRRRAIVLILIGIVVVTGSAVAFAVSRSGDSAVRCPAGYGYTYGVNVRGHCTPPSTRDDAVTGDRFVGHWSVHGSQLEIRPNGTGTIESNCGGAVCVETDALSVVRSVGGKRLTATITKIRYANNKGEPIPGPDPRESPAVGDAFYFRFVAPHLMKLTIVRSSFPWLGNPYWCGDGLAASLEHFCGA